MNRSVSPDEDMNPDISLTAESKNLCLQYLLDELDAEQVKLFEEELAESTSLGDELRRQAEMVSMLSDLNFSEAIPPVQTAPALQTGTWWRIACIALAVCCAGMVFRTWWQVGSAPQLDIARPDTLPQVVVDNHTDRKPDTAPEFTLIVRAWADGQLPAETGDRQDNAMPIATGDDHTLGDYFQETDDEVDDTSGEQRFSWIFTAASEI